MQSNAAFKWVPPSEKQLKVLTWWMDGSPYKNHFGIICDGSIRAGKTLAMSFSFVLWAMARFNGQNFGMAGKTIGSFKRNVWLTLRTLLKLRGFSIRKIKDMDSNNAYLISKDGVSNYFFIFGGKDEQSQELIAGITLAGMLFDEATLMPESFVNQAVGRCSVSKSKIWMNCNPGKPRHYIKIEWIGKQLEKNLLHLHFTMEDNPSLDGATKLRYRNLHTGIFYQRYVLGLWVLAAGLIYGTSFSEKEHIIDVDIKTRYTEYFVSVDYGVQNPMVYLLWGFNSHKKRFECIRQYYYCGREQEIEKDDQEYYVDLVEFLDGINPSAIIIDPSASSFIACIKKHNKYRVKRAKNAVEKGIRSSSTALKLNLVAFDRSCKEIFEEFGTYSWDSKKAENLGKEVPLKQDDHCLDAFRYFVETIVFKKYQWLIRHHLNKTTHKKRRESKRGDKKLKVS